MSAYVSPMRTVPGISAAEFHEIVMSLWARNRFNREKVTGSIRKLDLCLAISGGSDSMALAFLCQQLREQLSRDGIFKLGLNALIVDHQLRYDSHSQIFRTYERLVKMGIRSKVIRLEWPSGISPSKVPNMESMARRLRYRALGKGCAQLGNWRLCLGHHSDDQAESILMDLANSRGIGKTRWMNSVGRIPECEGIHGIHSSGVFERSVQRLLGLQLRHGQNIDPSKIAHLQNIVKSPPPLCESGDLYIWRPLLTFSKKRLRQTCKDNSIEWEEDESNHDVRVTSRNTVRSLLSSGRLPQALQIPSLLRIGSREAASFRRSETLAIEMLEGCEVLMLDVRSSILMIRIQSSMLPNEPSRSFACSVATQLVRRIASAVTCDEATSLGCFYTAVRVLFPNLQDSNTPARSIGDNAPSFTAGGVHFLRRRLKRIRSGPAEPSSQQHDDELDPEFVWVLSRQTFSALSRPEPHTFSQESSVLLRRYMSPDKFGYYVTGHDHKKDHPWSWSAWKLWDGRYWIRVRHAATRKYVLRTWEESEMPDIRAGVAPCVYERFRRALKDAAPGKIRWTLPVIAEVKNKPNQGEYSNPLSLEDARINSENKNKPNQGEHSNTLSLEDARIDSENDETRKDLVSSIVVFPTLGKAGWLDILDQDGNRKLEWEVRYKQVALRRRDGQFRIWGYDPKNLKAWDDGGQGEQTVIPFGWKDHSDKESKRQVPPSLFHSSNEDVENNSVEEATG